MAAPTTKTADAVSKLKFKTLSPAHGNLPGTVAIDGRSSNFHNPLLFL
jgi:hypothetical protein